MARATCRARHREGLRADGSGDPVQGRAPVLTTDMGPEAMERVRVSAKAHLDEMRPTV